VDGIRCGLFFGRPTTPAYFPESGEETMKCVSEDSWFRGQ
jgi:hypothetical protein